MKLPHVTIEYREDENYAIGKMSPWLIIGLALCLAWALVTLLNGHTLIFPNVAELRENFNNSAIFVYACAFLCYGVFHKQMRSLFSTSKKRNRNRLVGTLLMSLSAAIMAIANAIPDVAPVIVFIAGCMAGLGSTILTMSFAVSFSVCDVATASMSAGLSFALAVVFYALVAKYCAGMVALCTALCVLCPIAEFFCLYQCSRQLVDHLKFKDLTIPVKPRPFSLHVILPCLLVGFVISTVRVSMTEAFLGNGDANAALLAVLGGAVLSLLLIIGAILTQRQRFNFMARTLFPVSALALGFLAFTPQDQAPAIFLLTCAYVLLDCALWVCLSDISQRFRVSAFVSFGFGYGALMMGSFAALVLLGDNGPLHFLMADHESLAVVSLVLLSFSFAFLPNTTEVVDSLDIKGRCPALTTDALELDMLQNPPRSGAAGGPQDRAAAALGKESADSSWNASGMDTESATAFSEQERELESPRNTPHETNTETIAAQNARNDAQVGTARGSRTSGDGEPQTPNQRKGAEPRRQEPDAFDELDELDEQAAMRERTQSNQPGRFKRKCAKVAETYLLSRKETEVLFLLAKGRNAAAIQKTLYIAAGTANTHMRHIYRKLDVHSQQELIRLVEATEVDDG